MGVTSFLLAGYGFTERRLGITVFTWIHLISPDKSHVLRIHSVQHGGDQQRSEVPIKRWC